MRVGQALGMLFDSELLQSVHDGLTTLQRHGGEVYMCAVREKRTVDHQLIPPEQWDDIPGYFSTPMIATHYSHVGRPKDQPRAEPEPNRGQLMDHARDELQAVREAQGMDNGHVEPNLGEEDTTVLDLGFQESVEVPNG